VLHVWSRAAGEVASHTNAWPQPMQAMVTGSGMNGFGTGSAGPGLAGGGLVMP